jgi:hypothetical protein
LCSVWRTLERERSIADAVMEDQIRSVVFWFRKTIMNWWRWI